MLVRVAVQQGQRDSVAVPEAAIQYEGDGAFVYRIAAGDGKSTAQRVEVETGAVENGFVEIALGASRRRADRRLRPEPHPAELRRSRSQGQARGREAGRDHPGRASCRDGCRAMMLSDLAVRRPVFAAVAAIVLCVIGLAAFFFLPVRELPDVDPPIVSVSTSYAGASAEVIESRITEPIEQQLAGIQGVERITSTSRDGRSNVTIEFALDRDIDVAANDVRDRVSRAQGGLAGSGRPADRSPRPTPTPSRS